ncbi:MAG: hypothetical protein ED859_11795 [Desulfuromonadales bacterium]|nr:MAG: hypothetical protein ED859_11795 [Desulfuromonadales bacterium]
MRIPLALFILLLSATNVVAESQPTSARTKKQKPEIQKTYSSKSDNKITQTTITTAAQTTTNNPNNRENDKTPKDPNIIINEKIAQYTGYLAILAFLQFVAMGVQAWFLCKTLGATKEAANAAQDSADCLAMIERAYVFAAVRMEEWKIIIDLKNHGKTPAILKSLYVTRKFHPTPPQEIDTRPKSMIPDGVVIGADVVWPATITPWLTESERKMLDRPDFKLFCFGVVEYLDILNQKRTTGFCWQFNYQYGVGEWSIADSKLNHYDSDISDNKQHHAPEV